MSMVGNSEIGLIDTGRKEGEAWEDAQSQRVSIEEPTLIQSDASGCNRAVESEATCRVQKNIIKLSKEFDAIFDGLEEDAKALLEKLEQRRGASKINNYTN